MLRDVGLKLYFGEIRAQHDGQNDRNNFAPTCCIRLARAHCGGNIADASMFPKCWLVLPRGQHLWPTQTLCPRGAQQCCRVLAQTSNVSSRTRCYRHNVSSFCRSLEAPCVQRTQKTKMGTRCQHVSNKTWSKRSQKIREYVKGKRRTFYFAESFDDAFISPFLFVGTHFWIFVRKFLDHLRTVYASPQKLARPLVDVHHSIAR